MQAAIHSCLILKKEALLELLHDNAEQYQWDVEIQERTEQKETTAFWRWELPKNAQRLFKNKERDAMKKRTKRNDVINPTGSDISFVNIFDEVMFGAKAININGIRFIPTPTLLDPFMRRKTWKERFLSWPWNPWKSMKINGYSPSNRMYCYNQFIYAHPNIIQQIEEVAKIGEGIYVSPNKMKK